MNNTEDLDTIIEILKDALRDELEECGADLANDEPLCDRYVCQLHGCVFDKLCRLRKAAIHADLKPAPRPA